MYQILQVTRLPHGDMSYYRRSYSPGIYLPFLVDLDNEMGNDR